MINHLHVTLLFALSKTPGARNGGDGIRGKFETVGGMVANTYDGGHAFLPGHVGRVDVRCEQPSNEYE